MNMPLAAAKAASKFAMLTNDGWECGKSHVWELIARKTIPHPKDDLVLSYLVPGDNPLKIILYIGEPVRLFVVDYIGREKRENESYTHYLQTSQIPHLRDEYTGEKALEVLIVEGEKSTDNELAVESAKELTKKFSHVTYDEFLRTKPVGIPAPGKNKIIMVYRVPHKMCAVFFDDEKVECHVYVAGKRILSHYGEHAVGLVKKVIGYSEEHKKVWES